MSKLMKCQVKMKIYLEALLKLALEMASPSTLIFATGLEFRKLKKLLL